MKKSLVILILSSMIGFLQADINVVVSILPQKSFVKAIGGDKVDVALMVKPGNSPHSYEPKPTQMIDISNAQLYFAIGVEFEKAWLKRFQNQNKDIKIVDISEGIKKKGIKNPNPKDEKLDPHVWTSPSNVKHLAKKIYETLAKNDKANRSYYEANYKKFLSHIENTDKSIKTILKDTKNGSKFMVFHPAWGYFAYEYGLKQIAIEAGGKNPKPKQIAHLIKEAKKEGVKAIFTAPEFSKKTAKLIATEVGVPVVSISPLNPKWSQNLIDFAAAIAK